MNIIKKYIVLLIIISAINCNASSNDNTGTPPEVITFTTTGSSFSPVIIADGSPEITWTWDDNTTSNSTTPTKNYGSEKTRVNTLKVNPWSTVTRINIGYGGEDGGSVSIEHVANQNVTSVEGLDVVAPYLHQWCSSYNYITSLDFSNFTQLDTIECYLSQSLVVVNLANTPALQRACFEDCNLLDFDLSQSPNLSDLRGAANAYPTINFGSIGTDVWHICIRDNPQMTNQYLFSNMTQFPNIQDLWIWNCNQTGALNVLSSSPSNGVSILAYSNQYTSANFNGALQNSLLPSHIEIQQNQLNALNITGCSQITYLDASYNSLSEAAVDSILETLDTLGRSGDTVDLRNNVAPSATGLLYKANLEGKGWKVYVDP